jgi:hypothetical protein
LLHGVVRRSRRRSSDRTIVPIVEPWPSVRASFSVQWHAASCGACSPTLAGHIVCARSHCSRLSGLERGRR